MALYGVYRGTVVDTSQLQNNGRVKVTVPSAGAPGAWAPVTYSCACAWGIQAGATVIVAFEGGDVGSPVVLGQIES